MSREVCFGEARLTAEYSEPNRHRSQRFSVSVGVPLHLTWCLRLYSGIAQVKIVTGEISCYEKTKGRTDMKMQVTRSFVSSNPTV